MRIANWMMDKKWITFLIVVVPTVLMGWAIPSIEVYSRFADLLPAKHEYIQNYNRMKQTFGGANVVTMALEVTDPKADIFTVDTLQKVKMLTEQVDMIKGVNHYQVASIAHPKIRRIRTTAGGLIKSEAVLPKDLPTDPEAMKKLREESFNNDIVYGTYISQDGRAALILAGFDEERLNYTEIHTRLQELKAEVEADGKTALCGRRAHAQRLDLLPLSGTRHHLRHHWRGDGIPALDPLPLHLRCGGADVWDSPLGCVGLGLRRLDGLQP